jgi:hypothetical protein
MLAKKSIDLMQLFLMKQTLCLVGVGPMKKAQGLVVAQTYGVEHFFCSVGNMAMFFRRAIPVIL